MANLVTADKDWLDNCVTQISDATREKSLASKKLVFPGEIVSTIKSIPSPLTNDIYMIYDAETSDEMSTLYNTECSHTANRKQGNYGFVIIGTSLVGQNANVGCMVVQTFRQGAIDLSHYNYFAIDIYNSAVCPDGQFQINFVSGTEGTDGFNYNFSISNWKVGWHKVIVARGNISQAVAADWTQIKKIRYTYFNHAQVDNGVQFIIDNFIAY